MFCLVDDEYYESLNKFSWHVHNLKKINKRTVYVVRSTTKDGKTITYFMHREIMNAKPNQKIDHINGDGLDNRRKNLRFATQQQNMWNKRKHKKSQSGIKGVTKIRGKNIWVAQICINKRSINLGRFKCEEEAKIEYEKNAKKYFGEYANV